MYVSQLNPNELVIDDSNWDQFTDDVVVDGERKEFGLIARDWERMPYGAVAAPFDIPLIPRSEWPDRIAEMERTKSRLTDLCDLNGLSVLDQNGTNYCWINGVTHCVEIIRMVQGQEMVRLSPASAGGPITGYRNVGGYGSEGLEYVIEHGLVPQSMWPPNAISRRYDTAETRAAREKFKVVEWWDVIEYGQRSQAFDRIMTLLLNRIPAAVAYNWWRHLVTAVDPVVTGNGFGIRINNSWGTRWGTNGRSVLMEGKGTPNEACAPRVATAS